MVRGPRSGAQAVDEHVEQQAQAPLQPANLPGKGLQCPPPPPRHAPWQASAAAGCRHGAGR